MAGTKRSASSPDSAADPKKPRADKAKKSDASTSIGSARRERGSAPELPLGLLFPEMSREEREKERTELQKWAKNFLEKVARPNRERRLAAWRQRQEVEAKEAAEIIARLGPAYGHGRQKVKQPRREIRIPHVQWKQARLTEGFVAFSMNDATHIWPPSPPPLFPGLFNGKKAHLRIMNGAFRFFFSDRGEDGQIAEANSDMVIYQANVRPEDIFFKDEDGRSSTMALHAYPRTNTGLTPREDIRFLFNPAKIDAVLFKQLIRRFCGMPKTAVYRLQCEHSNFVYPSDREWLDRCFGVVSDCMAVSRMYHNAMLDVIGKGLKRKTKVPHWESEQPMINVACAHSQHLVRLVEVAMVMMKQLGQYVPLWTRAAENLCKDRPPRLMYRTTYDGPALTDPCDDSE